MCGNLKNVITLLKNPLKIFWVMGKNGHLKWVPDKAYLHIVFRAQTGKKLTLKNPKTFNEKLQWLKLYDKKPEYKQLVDKYEVRKYIEQILGDECLIPIIGVYDRFEDIDFDTLPNQFVLKCTHDSGSIIECREKAEFNIKSAKKKINRCLKSDYYYTGREWPYRGIKPRIVCEKYMVDESGIELKDYKIFCFNGEPKLIKVDFNRFSVHSRNYFTPDWQFVDIAKITNENSRPHISKPERLEDMLNYARILSKDKPHVRIDFYIVYNQIYFGEITFFHHSGYARFSSEIYNELLGSWIKLPEMNNA